MQRVLAVLDDKLPMRKSLRRLRTEDYQRGSRVLKSKFAVLRNRCWIDLKHARARAAGQLKLAASVEPDVFSPLWLLATFVT